jgi:hypothetical protein
MVRFPNEILMIVFTPVFSFIINAFYSAVRSSIKTILDVGASIFEVPSAFPINIKVEF